MACPQFVVLPLLAGLLECRSAGALDPTRCELGAFEFGACLLFGAGNSGFGRGNAAGIATAIMQPPSACGCARVGGQRKPDCAEGQAVTRIVYGVSGEGSGHSSRAREMARYLESQGHDLWLVSYDRGYRNLKEDFRVFETEGLTIASADNKVSIVRTFTENVRRLPEGHRRLQQLRAELFKQFQPHCVITDFEPMTAYLANHYDLPLITIDNQHRMRYMEFDCPPGMEGDRLVTKTVIRAMVPRPDISLVITFMFGPTTNDRTLLFPPILRQAVLDASPSHGDHYLVYVTSGYESLLEQLSRFERETFLVYGYDRSDTDGPLQYRPFSRDQFLADLAAARGVIATAGFTLISEALYLRKPYCAFPMEGQFEQQLNATMLAQLGYGKNVQELVPESISDFFYRLPDYDLRLHDYPARDNREIQQKLGELVADDAQLAQEYHERRQRE